jgi:hypothetical protein
MYINILEEYAAFINPEDGGSMLVYNVHVQPEDYKMKQHRRPQHKVTKQKLKLSHYTP